jgi:hypothetical protein
MVKTVAKRATDPKRLAKFEAENPEEAAEIRASLRKLAQYAQSQPARAGQSLGSGGKEARRDIPTVR